MAFEIVVVGSGKRVVETALPAMLALGERVAVRRVFARTAKTITAGGRSFDVAAADALDERALAGAELVYVAVGKDAVPSVLARLAQLDAAGLDLLIDTPVVRFKHFRHARLVERFRRAWVAEDVVELPWIETVRRAAASNSLGALHTVVFQRSAYAYHGLATARALLGAPRILRASRRWLAGQRALREIVFEEEKRAYVVEPRDYALGRFFAVGAGGVLADRPLSAARAFQLVPQIAGGLVRGFRAGDVATELAPEESELTRGAREGASVIELTEPLKRVAFARLLRRIVDGQGGYPIEDGLDDMVVDYHLEKLGRYRANPFTSPRSAFGRKLLAALSRAGG